MQKCKFIKGAWAALSLALVFTLAACSNTASGSSGAQNYAGAAISGSLSSTVTDENQVVGLFSSTNGDTINLELVDMRGMPGGGIRGNGGPGQNSAPAEVPPESGSRPGSPPEGMEPPDGASFPEGERPEGEIPGGSFETTGETREITVTGDTAIVLTGSDETLALADLADGDVLMITLDNDGTTAVSIHVMRQMRGAEGA